MWLDQDVNKNIKDWSKAFKSYSESNNLWVGFALGGSENNELFGEGKYNDHWITGYGTNTVISC